MIRISEIQNAMLPLIGWRQGYDANDVTVSEALTVSESGLYYQDAHPLLTLQNLSSVAPDFKNTSYETYDSEKSYRKGEIVTSDNQLYKAVQSVLAEENIELTNREYWAETDVFSEWLENKTRASITKVITRYVNEKIVKGTYKVLCEKKTLFDGTGRIYDTIKNKQNLVGFEIVPIRAKGVTTKINRIGLQFSQIGHYTVFVMHSSLAEPYYAETFLKTKANSMEWFTPSEEICLPYENDKIDAGGSWYICYFQSDLPVDSQAIRKNRDWSKGPCNECSKHEYETWKIWSKYLEVNPFYVNEELVESINPFSEDFNGDYESFNDEHVINSAKRPYLWDIKDNMYDYSTNYGLNLDISVSCDITEFIIEQKNMFQSCLMLQVASDFLREFAYNANVRTNRHSINASRMDILYELDGDSTSKKKAGINYQLELALKAISISTEGMDRVCMPCINHGVKYRTV